MGRFGSRGPRRFSPSQSRSPIYGNGSEGYRRPPPNPYPETAVPGPIYGRGYPVRVASRPVPDDPPPRERIWHPVVQHHVHRNTPPPLLARPVTSRPRSIVHMRTAGPVPPLHIAPVPPPPHKEPVRATVVAERFVPKELLIKFRGETPSEMIEAFAREQKLERISIEHFEMIDSTYYRYRLMRPDAVGAVAKTLESHALVAAIQPNYKYDLEDAPGAPGYSAAQYAVSKMSLNEAHRRAVGSGELVAVINSGVDARHPELEGSVKEQFDEVGEDNRPDPHGTSVAGVIGAHAQLVGVAPRALILAIRAFSRTLSDPGAQGTTLHIARAIELAHARGVRLVNMSFAGPKDPMIEEEVRNGHRQKMIFVAAAGNDGPKSAPLYPAAYSEVIAATATDGATGSTPPQMSARIFRSPLPASICWSPSLVTPIGSFRHVVRGGGGHWSDRAVAATEPRSRRGLRAHAARRRRPTSRERSGQRSERRGAYQRARRPDCGGCAHE